MMGPGGKKHENPTALQLILISALQLILILLASELQILPWGKTRIKQRGCSTTRGHESRNNTFVVFPMNSM